MTISARRRKRKLKNTKKPRAYLKLIAFCVLMVFTIYFLKFTDRYWDGLNKITIVVNAPESIRVLVFNPIHEEIVDISIPKNTQVDVSRQLGKWRIGSVWQLGINEGYDGELLAETVTKNFSFPVFLWADEGGINLMGGNFINTAKGVFSRYDTNIPFLDRVAISLFSLGVRNTQRVSIDLSRTSYLDKIELEDGGEGFVIKEKIPEKLSSYFSESEFLDNSTKVIIRDATGTWGISKSFSKTVEVLGAKVVAVTSEEETEGSCIVNVNDDYYYEIFKNLYECEMGDTINNNLEIEIILGNKFSKDF